MELLTTFLLVTNAMLVAVGVNTPTPALHMPPEILEDSELGTQGKPIKLKFTFSVVKYWIFYMHLCSI